MDKEVLRRINRQSFIIVPLLAGLSYVFTNDLVVSLNVILGGLLSWLSLRELAWAVKKFFGKPMFQLTVIGLSYIKLGAIFLFLWFIAIKGLFNIKGLLIGFVAILVISTKEAYLYVKRRQNEAEIETAKEEEKK